MRLSPIVGLALALLGTPRARAGDGEGCPARLSTAEVARRAGHAVRARGYDPTTMRVEVDERKALEPTNPPRTDGEVWLR
jgi:hypothetical protein